MIMTDLVGGPATLEMSSKCQVCGGWVEYDPDHLADRCWSCGWLGYHFTPDNSLPVRRANYNRTARRSTIVAELSDLFRAHHTPIRIRDITGEMFSRYGRSERYVRQLLSSRVEFTHVGRGWWMLTDLDRSNGN